MSRYCSFSCVSRKKLDCVDCDSTENHRPKFTSEKRSETQNYGEKYRLVRSYGTSQHLVLKTLNYVLASVEDDARCDGPDVEKVDSSSVMHHCNIVMNSDVITHSSALMDALLNKKM